MQSINNTLILCSQISMVWSLVSIIAYIDNWCVYNSIPPYIHITNPNLAMHLGTVLLALWRNEMHTILRTLHKTAVTPVLMHCSYLSIVLNHWYSVRQANVIINVLWSNKLMSSILPVLNVNPEEYKRMYTINVLHICIISATNICSVPARVVFPCCTVQLYIKN